MNRPEFEQNMDEYWERANEEALRLKDSYLALDRLSGLYRKFDEDERSLADEVLAEWVLSDQQAKRFDAMALIRDFRVRSALPALEQLLTKLAADEAPGAPFEREKAADLIRELDQVEGSTAG